MIVASRQYGETASKGIIGMGRLVSTLEASQTLGHWEISQRNNALMDIRGMGILACSLVTPLLILAWMDFIGMESHVPIMVMGANTVTNMRVNTQHLLLEATTATTISISEETMENIKTMEITELMETTPQCTLVSKARFGMVKLVSTLALISMLVQTVTIGME